jgi:transposase
MSTMPQDREIAAVRLRRPDRTQVLMTVQCPDDLIPPQHPARLVWQVVGTLDLSAFREPIKARQGVCGRDATDPALLIALWLYATIRGIGSAREVARLCVESAPYQWLCGGVSLNHHTLGDFRVGHGAALDELFTRLIATLVEQGLVKVSRISQDGTRVRACCGASSMRRKERLEQLLAEAAEQVRQVKALLDDPARSAGLSGKRKSARRRAARQRQERVERALEQLPELEAKQAKLAKKVSKKDKAAGKLKEPRASTTDAQARVMKMPDGGFRPAVNMQFATDTQSRAIVGVEVVNQGVDTGQAEPMRSQVERRSGAKVSEHLLDGGYLVLEEIERAAHEGVTLYVPPKPPRNKEKRGSEYEPRADDSEEVKRWRQRMGSAQGQAIYKERAATSETVNADAKAHRGLARLTVRGVPKAKCVALWFALAYNLMHFGSHLIG